MGLALNPLAHSGAPDGQAQQALRQARQLMGHLSPRQRYGIGGGVAAVIVVLVVFVHLMAKPGYSVLYSALQPADAQEVANVLSGLSIPYDASTDGTSVSVPSVDLDRARVQLAARGLPHSGQMGFELFDKTNWSSSDFAEQVNYQRALEGELERTIETIRDVQAARVHITMAHDSLFTTEQRPAKAAVLLTLRDGTLDPTMATAIQHLVASSVDHLSPVNVAIMDASGQMSLVSSPGGAGSLAQTQLEDALRNKILATLAPVVGAAHVRASVAVEYDPTSADDTQETYDPQTTAVLSSQSTSTVGPSAAGAAGVPGTTSNLPKAQAPGTSFNAELGVGTAPGQQSEDQTFAVSRSVNHIVRPAGSIQRVTAAVVVDDGTQTVVQQGKTITVPQPRSAGELTQLQALAAAAIGIDTSRGDVLTISNLPFTAPPAAAPAPAPAPLSPLQKLESGPAVWGGGALLLLLLLAGGWLLGRRQGAVPPTAPAVAQLRAPAARADDHEATAMAASQATVQTAEAATPYPEYINVTDLLKASPLDVPPELQSVMQLKDRLAERVRHEPAIASRLVRVWMNKRGEESA